MQMAPPTPPSQPASLPVLVISILHRFLPPFQSLCQATGRTTLTGAPPLPPNSGAAAGQGAGGSGKAQRRWLPQPLFLILQSRLPPLPRCARMAAGAAEVCVTGETVSGPRCSRGHVLSQGRREGCPPTAVQESPREEGELSTEPGGTGPGVLPASRDPPQNRGESCRPLRTHEGFGVGEQPFARVCCLPKGWSRGGGREPAAAGLTFAAQRG